MILDDPGYRCGCTSMRAWPHVVLGSWGIGWFFVELFSILVNARTLCRTMCDAHTHRWLHSSYIMCTDYNTWYILFWILEYIYIYIYHDVYITIIISLAHPRDTSFTNNFQTLSLSFSLLCSTQLEISTTCPRHILHNVFYYRKCCSYIKKVVISEKL